MPGGDDHYAYILCNDVIIEFIIIDNEEGAGGGNRTLVLIHPH